MTLKHQKCQKKYNGTTFENYIKNLNTKWKQEK
jgi:hypothetical protein